MKIIDKTPLQNERGQIDLMRRIQGTLKYGFSWYGDLEAQKVVIAQLERALERGFVLIRNFTLPGSEIVIPIILLGPGGVSVMHVSNVKGFFEAKGDQWNTLSNGRGSPASVNLLTRVAGFARAFQVYLDRQKIQIPGPVEPVLIAANPGAHIESLRPVARVVMSDAIRQFAATLIQARPVWRSDNVHDVADRIVNPRPPEALQAQAPQRAPEAGNASVPERTPSRAAAIFEEAQKVKGFDPSDLDFAFEGDETGAPKVTGPSLETSPARPLSAQSGARTGRFLGMTGRQVALLVGLILVECCVLVGFGAFIFLSQ